jgi:hypothetical protein
MKAIKITYYASTGLLTAALTMSAGAYIFNHEFFVESFTSLGFPIYLIYFIAIAKLLAAIAFWLPKTPNIKEWAYAGICFDFTLALTAHLNVDHKEYIYAIVALAVLFISYLSYHKYKRTQL